MRTLFLSAVAITVVLIVLIGLIIYPLRQNPIPTYNPLPAEFLPGQPPPTNLCCCFSWSHYDWPQVECAPPKNSENKIWVSYNAHTQALTHVTMMEPGKTVGDVIIAWGSPTGYRRTNADYYLYWPGRYIYSFSKPRSKTSPLITAIRRLFGLDTVSDETTFSPNAEVAFVAYDNVTPLVESWRGFRNSK